MSRAMRAYSKVLNKSKKHRNANVLHIYVTVFLFFFIYIFLINSCPLKGFPFSKGSHRTLHKSMTLTIFWFSSSYAKRTVRTKSYLCRIYSWQIVYVLHDCMINMIHKLYRQVKRLHVYILFTKFLLVCSNFFSQ